MNISRTNLRKSLIGLAVLAASLNGNLITKGHPGECLQHFARFGNKPQSDFLPYKGEPLFRVEVSKNGKIIVFVRAVPADLNTGVVIIPRVLNIASHPTTTSLDHWVFNAGDPGFYWQHPNILIRQNSSIASRYEDIVDLYISADGRLVFGATWTGNFYIFNSQSGELLTKVFNNVTDSDEEVGRILDIAQISKNKWIVAHTNKLVTYEIKITARGEALVQRIAEKRRGYRHNKHVAISPNAGMLIVASRNVFGTVNEFKIVDTNNLEIISKFPGERDDKYSEIVALWISNNGEQAYILSEKYLYYYRKNRDNSWERANRLSLENFKILSKEELRQLPTDKQNGATRITSAAFSPDAQYLLIGTKTGQRILVDINKAKVNLINDSHLINEAIPPSVNFVSITNTGAAVTHLRSGDKDSRIVVEDLEKLLFRLIEN